MEGEIASKTWVEEREMLFQRSVGRVYGFHTSIETQYEIVEVKTQTQSVSRCNLLPELIETELSVRLFSIFAQCPDVACIDESRSVELPEQTGAILSIQIQLQITCLIDGV